MKIKNIMIYSLVMVFFVLQACVTTQIPVPKNEKDSLVVLPKLLIDASRAMHRVEYSVAFVLENVATRKDTRITASYLSDDYLILQDLPPGNYLIKEMISRYGWRSKKALTKYLEVEAGKLTIFPYKFVVIVDDNYLYYQYHEIEKEDMERIAALLGKQENFKHWKIKK